MKRFHKNYDPPIAYDPSSPNYKAKIFNLHKKRSKYLAGSMVHFKIGATKKEEDTLKIVAEVINGKYFLGLVWDVPRTLRCHFTSLHPNPNSMLIGASYQIRSAVPHGLPEPSAPANRS